MEINNIEFLLEDTPPLEATEFLESCAQPIRGQHFSYGPITDLEATEFLKSYVKLPGENLEITKADSVVDQVGLKKRGRPKVVSMSNNLLRERRDAANARERKRMNQMTRYRQIIY